MKGETGGAALKVTGGVAWIRLTRPRAENRIDQATARELCDIAEAVRTDDEIALAVLEGSGRHFCLGVQDGGEWEMRHDFVEALARLAVPVVAAVQGDAVAEGCELALACDLRLAGSGARFSLPQVSEGRLPRHGGAQRLARAVGRMRAMDLLLSGRTMRAREALDAGLINRLIPAARFRAGLRREVQALREKGPIALRFGKEAVARGLDLTLDQGIRFEQDLYVLLQTTGDRAEGIRAFLKKRKPKFRGR